MRRLIAGLVFGAIGFAAAAAQASWEDQLSLQMMQDENCEVTYITQVIERDLPEGKFIQALVGCADKRTFIAYRDKDLRRFKITVCKQDERAC
ncbi:MAG: hypothetical protein QNJ94_06970 [Alphaproteobacteria bacterium]|nr:hypothetical protein [Alphaproteobacteria bacterium]